MNRLFAVLCLVVVTASLSEATFDLLHKKFGKFLHKDQGPSYAPAYASYQAAPVAVTYHASVAVPYSVPTPVRYVAQGPPPPPPPAPVHYSAPAPVQYAAPAPVHYAAPAPAPVYYPAPAPAQVYAAPPPPPPPAPVYGPPPAVPAPYPGCDHSGAVVIAN